MSFTFEEFKRLFCSKHKFKQIGSMFECSYCEKLFTWSPEFCHKQVCPNYIQECKEKYQLYIEKISPLLALEDKVNTILEIIRE